MTSPRLAILDVGHGFCAVLRDALGTVMFDVPYGDVPRKFLREEGVWNLDAVFISHHHQDHCGGMSGFLGDDYHVRHLFCNSPRARETKAFEDLLIALDTARKSGLNRPDPRVLHFETDVSAPDVLERGLVQITIVGPDSVSSRATRELGGRRRIQTDHSLCGVARIDYDDRQRVLLTGDLNDRGLAMLRDSDPQELRAEVLVYPHHGGMSDVRDEQAFAEQIAELVRPALIVFSLARDKGQRPHPEVLHGLRKACPDAHVVCTQLSVNCHPGGQLPIRVTPVATLAAAMSEKPEHCCGGSVEVLLEEVSPVFVGANDHRIFVKGLAQPLCRAMRSV